MINEEKKCFFCGQEGVLHVHHCLHGCRRKKADKYGLTVYLCHHCHQQLHDHGVGDLFLEKKAQKYFEDNYGHEKWMKEFGKNYL